MKLKLHEYKSRIEKETLTVDDCRREEAKIAKWKSTVKKENLGEENIARLEGILDEILAEIQQKKAKLRTQPTIVFAGLEGDLGAMSTLVWTCDGDMRFRSNQVQDGFLNAWLRSRLRLRLRRGKVAEPWHPVGYGVFCV